MDVILGWNTAGPGQPGLREEEGAAAAEAAQAQGDTIDCYDDDDHAEAAGGDNLGPCCTRVPRGRLGAAPPQQRGRRG